MRLWSLHPKHLDPKGLVALWREALLAKKVLQGRTRGYRHHPQLARFQALRNPVGGLNAYLREVLAEAGRRGYHFDARKVGPGRAVRIPVKGGQLAYEWAHLGAKLKKRHPQRWQAWKGSKATPHPLFRKVSGGLESWERP